ncbi:glycosyltransferase [Candidatus Uhrbacteria bacterium]|nr:glycosyltransferase [Candidatus Uhrbacteria bacterium]
MRAGAERFQLDLMDAQERAGHAVAPFAMHYPKNLPSAWSDYFVSEVNTEGSVGYGVGAIRQLARALWSREAYKKMSKMIDAFRPDIVHIHNVHTHLSPSILKACARHNVPVVMSVHDYALVSANYSLWDTRRDKSMDLDDLGMWAAAKTRFIKGSFAATFVLEAITRFHKWTGAYDRRIDRYHVISDFIADVLVSVGYDAKKMVMHHSFTQPIKEMRKGDDGYVAYIGRLERYKGVHTLIEAMKAFPEVELRIAGTGSYEKELRALVGEGQKVKFLGFVSGDDLENLRSRSRVMVAPSIWHEVLGLVAIEAMSCGVPVIVGDHGGLREMVEDGVSGSVFRAGDADSLAHSLEPFIRDEGFAKSMGEAAYQRASQIVDPELLSSQIMDIYESVIDSRE